MVGKEEERMAMKLGRMMGLLKLPYEMILDIFSRVPLDCFLRLKLVCNQWFGLISNPDQDFFNSLFSGTKPGLLVVRKTGQETQFDYAQDYTSPTNLTRFKNPFKHPFPTDFRVVNICNGLICLVDFYPVDNSKVYVWNPLTGNHITIPGSPLPSRFIPHIDKDRFHQLDILYGFGFHPDTNTYKVLRFFSASPKKIGGYWDSDVTVYTLGKDSSWRTLKKIPYNISADNVSTALLNGFLHWFGPMLNESDGLSSPKQILVAFDMQAETFREITQPLGIRSNYKLTVGVLNGLLSIFCSLQLDKRIDIEIWVMEKYDVADSWRKHCKIEEPGVPGHVMRFLGDVDSQEIVITRGFCGDLFSYDLNTNLLTNLHMFDRNVWEAHFFKCSPVSPTVINGASRPGQPRDSLENKMDGQGRGRCLAI